MNRAATVRERSSASQVDRFPMSAARKDPSGHPLDKGRPTGVLQSKENLPLPLLEKDGNLKQRYLPGKGRMSKHGMGRLVWLVPCVLVGSRLGHGGPPETTAAGQPADTKATVQATYHESPGDPWMPRSSTPPAGATSHSGSWTLGAFESVQVNVDQFGNNIQGDADNEPSIAIDPRDPSRIVIGWRQFDTVSLDQARAGVAYSHDGGRMWTLPGSLTSDVYHHNSVVDSDANGIFYYLSVDGRTSQIFRSFDGGMSWNPPIDMATDIFTLPWMVIDRTDGIGAGNIYTLWRPRASCCSGAFVRSTDGGVTNSSPIVSWFRSGTMSVGPAGRVYVVGHFSSWGFFSGFEVAWSSNAQDPNASPTIGDSTSVGLGEPGGGGPNQHGPLGMPWIATDHSHTATRGSVYVLGSVRESTLQSPLDVRFARSTDGGETWSDPVRVNDDPTDNDAWQWFGTMSVAPNGRIDAIWNDTRNTGVENLSELYYAFSTDAGETWSKNIPVSPVFDSHVGWPFRNRSLGSYYDMISDDSGVNVAYAATFNGEQDVYYLRIGIRDCNDNGIPDEDDVATGGFQDCDGNDVPDKCQRDCNSTGIPDGCDIDAGTSADCDGNDNPDECDPDFDLNELIDECDPDVDGDGAPNRLDKCAFTPLGSRANTVGGPLGDTNGNCYVDLVDYWRFKNCLTVSGPGVGGSTDYCIGTFDFDDDRDIDLRDFAGLAAAFTEDPAPQPLPPCVGACIGFSAVPNDGF